MGVGRPRSVRQCYGLLDAYPAIVLCPPHLVPKWIREIEETIPGAKAMELTRIGRNADDPGDVNDVRHFLNLCRGKAGKESSGGYRPYLREVWRRLGTCRGPQEVC